MVSTRPTQLFITEVAMQMQLLKLLSMCWQKQRNWLCQTEPSQALSDGFPLKFHLQTISQSTWYCQEFYKFNGTFKQDKPESPDPFLIVSAPIIEELKKKVHSSVNDSSSESAILSSLEPRQGRGSLVKRRIAAEKLLTMGQPQIMQ